MLSSRINPGAARALQEQRSQGATGLSLAGDRDNVPAPALDDLRVVAAFGCSMPALGDVSAA